MSKPIPIILSGKIPGHRAAAIEVLKPEFAVVTQCTSVDEIKQSLEKATKEEGGEGDHPAAIIVGGGFSESDFQEARAAPGAEKLVWLRADPSKRPSSGGPPSAEEVAQRVRKGCDDHLDDILHRKDAAGKVWLF